MTEHKNYFYLLYLLLRIILELDTRVQPPPPSQRADVDVYTGIYPLSYTRSTNKDILL